MFRTLILNTRRITPSLLLHTREAEVVSDPFHFFIGGPKNNWDRINRIAAEANKVKIDYDAKYALKLKEAALKRGVSVKELKNLASSSVKKPKVSFNQTVIDDDQKTKQFFREYKPHLNKLDQVVKLDLLEKESKESITRIWTQFYSTKNGITAVIPVSTYSKMFQVSRKYPIFILPMPRENGLEFFFLQFQEHQCHMTTLLEYKAKGEKARPFLTMTHFPEFAKSKDIVLMRGEINDKPKEMITATNAQYLAFALQQFYSTDNRSRLELVRLFNDVPDKFDYKELIKEMDKIIPLK